MKTNDEIWMAYLTGTQPKRPQGGREEAMLYIDPKY
jgi:hypothetical protein